MKKILYFVVLAAIAVISLVSCEEEMKTDAPIIDQVTSLQITVKASPDELKGVDNTKTYINEASKTIYWGTGEYMKIGVSNGSVTAWGKSSSTSADLFDGDTQALFEFTITPDPEKFVATGDYTYYGLYPFSSAVTSNNTDPASYKVNLPPIQNATASSYDPKAYILVARPESGKTETNADWDAWFRRATALNKITLKNLAEDIKRVTITAPTGSYLAGGRHIDLTTGASGDIYNGGGRTETIEVKFATPLSGGSDMDVWFTSWDATIDEGSTLTVVAYSDTHSFTRNVVIPSGRSIAFKEGCLNVASINMADANVADNTELEDGDYVILAKSGENYYAVKAALDGNHLASVNYDGSLSAYYGDANLIWTITKVNGSYTVENDGKYLGYKNSSNEAFWLAADENWTTTNYLIDFTWDTNCYHATLNSNSNRKFSRNAGSNFFAFYTSDQQKDLILVPATEDTRTIVALSFDEDAINKTTANYEEFTGQTATAYPAETDITDNIAYALSGDAIGTVNASTGVVSLNGDTGMATITAAFAGDANYRPAEASYTIVVSSASGPQYEKVTSLSNVTAGDYIIVNDGYYLPNTASTSAGPAKSAVTISNDKVQNVTDAMTWTFSGTTDEMTIQSTADDDNYLYVSGNGNNNLRVSTTSHFWTISDYQGTPGAFSLKDNNQNRYCATYSAGSDWRSYNSYNAGNYGDGGRVYLYKLASGPAVTWNLESIAVTTEPTKTTYTEGESFDPAGMVVTGHFVDADDNTNTKDEAVTGYTIDPDGALSTTDVQVTITYQGKTATQDIVVNAAAANPNTSTEENPYSAAEATSLAQTLTSSESIENVYVSGIISQIKTAFNSQFNNVTFMISADGSSTGEFEIFRMPATSADDFLVGDAVEIKGTLVNYNGDTPEITTGAELINQLHMPTFTPNGGSFTTSQSVSISAALGATIKYSIDGTTPAVTYSSALLLTETTTVHAIAISGILTTGIATATFTKSSGGEEPTLQYTLDGTDSSQGSNGYATDSEITQSAIDWIATANTTINPWRFGGKNLSDVDRAVYSTTAIDSNISSIEVESGTATATVNSLTITVHNSAVDAASGSNAIATKSVTSGITSSTVTLTKTDATSWAGKYYRIVYNVTCGGSNQYVQFKSAKFYGTN